MWKNNRLMKVFFKENLLEKVTPTKAKEVVNKKG
jgi:hypothetical protein